MGQSIITSSSSSNSDSCDNVDNRWSDYLPKELIEDIVKRLSSVADSVRMGAVCRSWSSAASKSLKELRTRSNSSCQQIPWVMESDFCPGSRDVNCRIYSPSDKRMYKFAPFPAPPPEDHKHMLRKHFCIKHYRGIQCLGSVDEWLMVEDRTWHGPCRASGGESAKVKLYLFNPMTGEHVMLPSQSADIHVISPFISPKDSLK